MYVKYEKLRTHVLHKCPSKVPRRRLLAIATAITTFALAALGDDWPTQTSQHATVIPIDATHAFTALLTDSDNKQLNGLLTEQFLHAIDYYNHCATHQTSCYVLLNFHQYPQRATIYQDQDGTPKLAWQLSLRLPSGDTTVSIDKDPTDPDIHTL